MSRHTGQALRILAVVAEITGEVLEIFGTDGTELTFKAVYFQ